jgi:hypothetical protein
MKKKSIKFKEKQIIDEMVFQIEKELGMKCKVVPQSDNWYDGYCMDTSGLALQMYLGGFQKDCLSEYLKFVKEKIEGNRKNGRGVFKVFDPPDSPINTTITLINNGINRNLMRMGAEVPVEDVTPDYYLQK